MLEQRSLAELPESRLPPLPVAAQNEGLPTRGTLRAASRPSKLHDAGCARRYDDHAAERGGNEKGHAKRKLSVEEQERNSHRLQVLQDKDEHENQRSHQDDYGCPYGTCARARPVGLGWRSRGLDRRRL